MKKYWLLGFLFFSFVLSSCSDREADNLREDIATLQSENKTLMKKNNDLQSSNDKLQEKVDKTKKQLKELEEENTVDSTYTATYQNQTPQYNQNAGTTTPSYSQPQNQNGN